MAIYRILAKTSWNTCSADQKDDQFVDARNTEEAKSKFEPHGTSNTIDSINETPFRNVNDPKCYLVGLSPDWFNSNTKASDYFLVKAVDGRNAVRIVEENEVGKHGTSTKVNDVRYLGQLDTNKDITQLL
jgi:hypothetical protein